MLTAKPGGYIQAQSIHPVFDIPASLLNRGLQLNLFFSCMNSPFSWTSFFEVHPLARPNTQAEAV